MMQCRMCSQRLTRPGKLCRECGHELEQARLAGLPVDELAAVSPVDASRMPVAEGGARCFGRLRSRGSVLAAAFTIGVVGATAAHLAQRSNAVTAPGSVMLDRDLSELRPRSFARVSAHPTANEIAGGQAVAAVQANDAERSDPRVQTPGGDRARSFAQHRVTLGAQPTSTAEDSRDRRDPSERSTPPTRDASAPASAAMSDTSSEPRTGYDRVLAFADALARCGDETFFERIACAGRARARYCDGAAALLPQCASEIPRDHGR